jgi:hypothetical protein
VVTAPSAKLRVRQWMPKASAALGGAIVCGSCVRQSRRPARREGDSAIDDPDSGAVSGQFYEPIDDIARAALDKQDLGHGISGRTFRY